MKSENQDFLNILVSINIESNKKGSELNSILELPWTTPNITAYAQEINAPNPYIQNYQETNKIVLNHF